MGTLPGGTVTFLFTDIEGSTSLLHALGEQGYGLVLGTHRRLLRQAFAANGGVELGAEGDSFFVVFQRATDALAAALDGQLALERHDWDGTPVRVRMGLHTGEAAVVDGGYVGMSVHEAARIASAANGGQVLVSQSTQALTAAAMPDGMSLVDLGEHRLRDIADLVRLYRLDHAGLQAELPPPRTLSVLPNNLPVQLTSFVGRADEVARIAELVGSERLVTLTGSGGAGKTRLALEAAAELVHVLRHGVWFVELAPLTDPALVLDEVARAMDLRPDGSRTLSDVLLDHVRDRRLLVVLDNCEHLTDACAAACERLLRASSELRILATSREPLGARGERTHRVPSMDLPSPDGDPADSDAVRLFCQRAAEASDDFVLAPDDTAAVAEICRRLDGLPLPIELAAARVRMFTPAEIAQRLDRRFQILTGGNRTGLRRQQTLRATLDWSYDLLSGDEQTLFRRLSVFVGGFTLEAAEAVCAGRGIEALEVMDLLSALVDRSLVVAEPHEGRTRYALLETMREYARELLAGTDDADAVWSAHLSWCRDLALEARAGLDGPDEVDWLRRLDLEIDNIRQALSWATTGGSPVDGLRLTVDLTRYWGTRYLLECDGWASSTYELCDDLPDGLRAQALCFLAECAYYRDDHAEAVRRAEACIDVGEPRWAADAHMVLAAEAFQADDVAASIGHFETAVDLHRRTGYRRGQAEALRGMAQGFTWTKDPHRVRSAIQEAWELTEQLGIPSAIGAISLDLAYVRRFDADIEAALELSERALDAASRLGDPVLEARAHGYLALLLKDAGDLDGAERHGVSGQAIARDHGLGTDVLRFLDHFAMIALQRGDVDGADALLDEALGPDHAGLPPKSRVDGLNVRMFVAVARGDASVARAAAREIAERVADTSDPEAAYAHLALAELAGGDLEAARRYADAAVPWARDQTFIDLCNSLHFAGRIAFASGELAAARRMLAEALLLVCDPTFIPWAAVLIAEPLAWTIAAQGDTAQAAALLGAVEAVRHRHGYAIWPSDRPAHDAAMASCPSEAYERGLRTPLPELAKLLHEALTE